MKQTKQTIGPEIGAPPTGKRVRLIEVSFTFILAVICLTTLVVTPSAHAADNSISVEAFSREGRMHSKNYLNKLEKIRQIEIKTLGPSNAIETCIMSAPVLAMEMSRNLNISIKRVSLRPRNLVRGSADSWEQGVMLRFQDEIRSGTQTSDIEHAELVQEPTGAFLRYMKPILAKEDCLKCHGSVQLNPEVIHTLRRLYPNDLATGYSEGDMIGAVSLKKRLQ